MKHGMGRKASKAFGSRIFLEFTITITPEIAIRLGTSLTTVIKERDTI